MKLEGRQAIPEKDFNRLQGELEANARLFLLALKANFNATKTFTLNDLEVIFSDFEERLAAFKLLVDDGRVIRVPSRETEPTFMLKPESTWAHKATRLKFTGRNTFKGRTRKPNSK